MFLCSLFRFDTVKRSSRGQTMRERFLERVSIGFLAAAFLGYIAIYGLYLVNDQPVSVSNEVCLKLISQNTTIDPDTTTDDNWPLASRILALVMLIWTIAAGIVDFITYRKLKIMVMPENEGINHVIEDCKVVPLRASYFSSVSSIVIFLTAFFVASNVTTPQTRR